MLRFIELEVANFGSIGDRPVTFKFGNGLHSIEGENGFGKSTILDALSFASYRKPIRDGVTLADLVNWTNRTGLYVRLVLESGSNTYEIYRTMSTERLTKDSIEQTQFESKIAFQREIERIIGLDHELFSNLVAISAENNKPFLELKTQEKREQIERYFGLQMIGNMNSLEKTERTKEETNLKIARGRLDEKTKAHGSLASRVKFSREDFERNKQEHQNKIAEAKESVQTIKERWSSRLAEVERRKSERESELERVSELDAIGAEKVEELRNRLIASREALKAELDDGLWTKRNYNQVVAEQVAELTEELEQTERDHLSVANEKIAIAYSEFENSESLVSDVVHKLGLWRERVGADDMSKYLLVLAKEIANEHRIVTHSDEEMNRVLGLVIANLNQQKRDKEFVLANQTEKDNAIKAKRLEILNAEQCPLCGAVMDDLHKEAEIAKLKQERIVLLDQIAETKRYISDREYDLQRFVPLVEEFGSLLAEKAKAVEFSQFKRQAWETAKLLVNDHSLANQIRKQIDEHKSQLFDVSAIELEATQKLGNFDAESTRKINELSAEYDSESKRVELEKSISDLAREAQELESGQRVEIAEVETRIKVLEENPPSDAGIVKDEESLAEMEKDILDLESEVNKSERRLRIISKMIEITGDSGFKKDFLAKFIPILNSKVNKKLYAFGMPINITFDEKLNVKITNLGASKDTKYKQYSRGERTRITFAIFLSQAEILRDLLNWRSNLMIFDEFLDTGVDTKGAEALVESLKGYVETSKELGLYLISHKLGNNAIFDSRTLVQKTNGFSEYITT